MHFTYKCTLTVKMAGHPARYAACLRVEIEWEVPTWICPYHQDLWLKLRPEFKQTETSLAASSLYDICEDVWIWAADEDLEGLEFS